MRECEECGRLLEDNEKKLCPACQSKKSHQKKRWGQAIVSAIAVVGVFVVKILSGGKGGKES